MALQSRALGSTGIRVSEFCFGTWEIGGAAWGPIRAEDAVVLVQKALDQGVNVFDCSDAYGNGRAEVILGVACKGRRDEVVLITKVGYIAGIDGAQSILPKQYQNHSPEYIRWACELSLRRLQTDYIDVYLLHDAPMSVLRSPEPFAMFRQLQQAGRIRSWGVSSSAEGAALAIREHGAEVVMVPFSLIDQRPVDTLFPLARERGTGILARSPFSGGLLLDTVVAEARRALAAPQIFSPYDRRSLVPAERLHDIVRKADALSFLVGGAAPTLAAAALRFVLSFPEVSTVVTGVMRAEELDQNLAACVPPYYGPDEIARARALYAADFRSGA
jgi:aryl-alcohol dehydrogenase-like predicted oxidoreductase